MNKAKKWIAPTLAATVLMTGAAVPAVAFADEAVDDTAVFTGTQGAVDEIVADGKTYYLDDTLENAKPTFSGVLVGDNGQREERAYVVVDLAESKIKVSVPDMVPAGNYTVRIMEQEEVVYQTNILVTSKPVSTEFVHETREVDYITPGKPVTLDDLFANYSEIVKWRIGDEGGFVAFYPAVNNPDGMSSVIFTVPETVSSGMQTVEFLSVADEVISTTEIQVAEKRPVVNVGDLDVIVGNGEKVTLDDVVVNPSPHLALSVIDATGETVEGVSLEVDNATGAVTVAFGENVAQGYYNIRFVYKGHIVVDSPVRVNEPFSHDAFEIDVVTPGEQVELDDLFVNPLDSVLELKLVDETGQEFGRLPAIFTKVEGSVKEFKLLLNVPNGLSDGAYTVELLNGQGVTVGSTVVHVGDVPVAPPVDNGQQGNGSGAAGGDSQNEQKLNSTGLDSGSGDAKITGVKAKNTGNDNKVADKKDEKVEKLANTGSSQGLLAFTAAALIASGISAVVRRRK